MQTVTIDDVDVPTANPAERVCPLSDALETTDLAINYYVLGPGEQFGFDLHTHHDQEEVFYVRSGTATFETETDSIDVHAGEVVRFAPGEFQIGRNEGDEHVRAIALGAPRETMEIEYLRECPTCDERTVQPLAPFRETGAFVVTCATCGTETIREER